jgi:hypothetical protein
MEHVFSSVLSTGTTGNVPGSRDPEPATPYTQQIWPPDLANESYMVPKVWQGMYLTNLSICSVPVLQCPKVKK